MRNAIVYARKATVKRVEKKKKKGKEKGNIFLSCHAACDYDVLIRPFCGVDEWNGILVEVIGSFSGRISHAGTSLLALLPETLATPAVVYGAKNTGPCPQSSDCTTSIIKHRNRTGWGSTPQFSRSFPGRRNSGSASTVPFRKQMNKSCYVMCDR